MQLKSYLADFALFTPEEIEHAGGLFIPRKLNKSDYFVREGQKCSEVAFIGSGVFRSYYLAPNGNEMTYCFRFPGDMMAAYSSFITGKGSVECIQALSDAELLVIPKDQIDKLLAKSPAWIHFLKIMAEQQYLTSLPLLVPVLNCPRIIPGADSEDFVSVGLAIPSMMPLLPNL